MVKLFTSQFENLKHVSPKKQTKKKNKKETPMNFSGGE